MAKNLNVLYGKKSVYERLKVNPASIRKVFIEENFGGKRILELIKKNNIRVEQAEPWKIRHIKPGRNVQGITAKVEPYKYADYDKLLSKRCSMVFLDGINDPHNLGVIIRTLACLGGFAVVLPEKGACPVNDTAMHTAVGGENYISAALVPDLRSAIIKAKDSGLVIIGGTVDKKSVLIKDLEISHPVGLVFGSEEEGISPDIIKILDKTVHIPTPGADLSLNITIACGIVCSKITDAAD